MTDPEIKIDIAAKMIYFKIITENFINSYTVYLLLYFFSYLIRLIYL
jgi:hypothetical protein